MKSKGSEFDVTYRKLVVRLGHNKAVWTIAHAAASRPCSHSATRCRLRLHRSRPPHDEKGSEGGFSTGGSGPALSPVCTELPPLRRRLRQHPLLPQPRQRQAVTPPNPRLLEDVLQVDLDRARANPQLRPDVPVL